MQHPARRQRPAQPQHGVGVAEGQFAGIVAVGQIAVAGGQRDAAAAQAGAELQRAGERRRELRVGLAAVGAVQLVAAQTAGHAQHLRRAAAGEVLKALALILLPILRQAGSDFGVAPLPARAQVGAGIGAPEVDDAAAMPCRRLRGRRDGQPLRDRAAAVVERQAGFAQRATVGVEMAPAQAALRLLDGLAGVELCRHRRGRARIGAELRAAQAQRVLRALLVVGQQQRHVVAVAGKAQAQIDQRAARRALRSQAIDVDLAGRRTQVEAALQRQRQRHPPLHQAEAGLVDGRLGAGLGGRRGDQRDDAARAVAVERRVGATQHLDALRAGEIEVRHLALPVGHGRRDAVGIDTHTAHAEAGARAVAARTDLQVLRVVVAVGDNQARHPRQCLRQVDHRPGAAQRCRVDAGDGVGCFEQRGLAQRAGDDDGLRRFLGLRKHRQAQPAGEPAGGKPGRPAMYGQ